MEKKEIKDLNDCVTPEGIKVSGMGMIANNTAAILDKLDKIQKFLYFMEKRQQEMFELEKSKNKAKDLNKKE